MSISIETLEGLQRRVTITVPADKIEAAYKEQLKGYAKNARVDGFRKGKVPHSIIEQRFGLAARQDVLSDEMQKKLPLQAVRHSHQTTINQVKISLSLQLLKYSQK